MNNSSYPESNGRPVTFTVPDPAAGANFQHVFALGKIYELISVRYRIILDAAVANRNQRIRVLKSTNIIWESFAGGIAVASQTHACSFLAGITGHEDATMNQREIGSIPNRFFLLGGEILESDLSGIQPLDQIDQIVIHVNEWYAQST